MNLPHNIYIHVPFCMSKCRYCAFFSRACANPDWGAYTDGIVDEIEHWGRMLGRISVPTIFFGGGTPSLMPIVCFERIMNELYSCFDVSSDAEIMIFRIKHRHPHRQNKVLFWFSIFNNNNCIGVACHTLWHTQRAGRQHQPITISQSFIKDND